jgi:hypothetical protein
MKYLFIFLFPVLLFNNVFAQQSIQSGDIKQLQVFEDSLNSLGKKFINMDSEPERKNANYTFIKTLVSALKIPNSYLYPFDSVKSITIINSPDNKFRILSWHVLNDDGSYRFYGTLQINTGGSLKMFPLEDYSPMLKNPEDSVADGHKWFGAQYYKIVPIYDQTPYYVLLGWKGYTDKSTKKVIDVLSFKDDKPQFGRAVFDGNGKTRKRVVFEYTRQASMLLRYVPERNLIVFDHLSPPDPHMKGNFETYGPDLTYDGYRLKNGRWVFLENLDMRNVPSEQDNNYADPKKPTPPEETSGNN